MTNPKLAFPYGTRREKLSAAQAIDICQRAWSGEDTEVIANQYKITRNEVSGIKTGQNYGSKTVRVRMNYQDLDKIGDSYADSILKFLDFADINGI